MPDVKQNTVLVNRVGAVVAGDRMVGTIDKLEKLDIRVA